MNIYSEINASSIPGVGTSTKTPSILYVIKSRTELDTLGPLVEMCVAFMMKIKESNKRKVDPQPVAESKLASHYQAEENR